MVDGNVGIGTNTPSAALDVNGTASFGYAQLRPRDATNVGGGLMLEGAGDYSDWAMDTVGGAFRLAQVGQPAPLLQALNGVIDVAGSLRIRGGHLPDYDSGWLAEDTNTSHTRVLTHSLGVLPSRMTILVSSVADGSWARIASGTSPGDTNESPESSYLSTTEVRVRFHFQDNFLLCDLYGWWCPDGVATSKTGYIRVLLWR